MCERLEDILMLTFRSREDGQTMAEYAVILGVITLSIVAAVGVLTTAISGAITSVAGLM
jgi:Flp pilus assembly pilin Flp